jgi:hypothetical protein
MQLTLESVFKDAQRVCDEVIADADVWPTLRRLSRYVVAGSALYGFAMGLRHSLTQAAVSAGKVPVLFFLTLLICLPTLHFVGLLFGSRVRFVHSLAVLLAGIAATSILLAAFAPIALFFLVSGSTYPFLLLMHVAIFAFCGAAGLRSIRGNFEYMRARTVPPGAPDASPRVLRVWTLLYMLVGTQMAYVLGPFVGRETTFLWFHHPAGNFYTYVLSTFFDLLR